MMDAALEMAELIASKSPVAVQGTKLNMIYSRDHSVSESLDYMVSVHLLHISITHSVSKYTLAI